jgi:hypothetical protein
MTPVLEHSPSTAGLPAHLRERMASPDDEDYIHHSAGRHLAAWGHSPDKWTPASEAGTSRWTALPSPRPEIAWVKPARRRGAVSLDSSSEQICPHGGELVTPPARGCLTRRVTDPCSSSAAM